MSKMQRGKDLIYFRNPFRKRVFYWFNVFIGDKQTLRWFLMADKGNSAKYGLI